MSELDIWRQFDHDPRTDTNAPLRASNRDRDTVNSVLASAYAEGRLTAEEFDERTDAVAHARTLGELPPLMSGLIAPVAGGAVSGRFRVEAERRYRERTRNALWAFLTPTLICWIIWISVLAAGEGTPFPWPAFVMIGTGAGWVRLVTAREDSIASIEHELEKREARKIERQQRRELPPGD